MNRMQRGFSQPTRGNPQPCLDGPSPSRTIIVQKEVDAELAKRLCAETKRDYLFFLEETARFVLGMAEEKAGEVTVQADID